MNIFAVFSLWFVLAQAVLTAVQIIFRKKEITAGKRFVLAGLKLFLSVLFAFLVLAGPVQLRVAQPFMMALYVALFADAAADFIVTAVCAAKKSKRSIAPEKALSLILGVAFLVYGMVNMQTVKPVYHTYTSEKLTSEYKFVFVADMHVGSAQPFSVTEKTVEAIKAQNPDFVILGGDITDDYTTKEEMINTFKLFEDFGVPVCYVYGNHDRQGHAEYAGGLKYTREELADAMEQSGIIILDDKNVRISPELILLGREDFTEGDGRAKTAELISDDPDVFLLVADHQPSGFKEAADCGADLQVSGHTHAGQLFPLGVFYRLIGYCHGDYEYGGAILNVSSGSCGWRMPLRTQAHSNFEVITLSPAQG